MKCRRVKHNVKQKNENRPAIQKILIVLEIIKFKSLRRSTPMGFWNKC